MREGSHDVISLASRRAAKAPLQVRVVASAAPRRRPWLALALGGAALTAALVVGARSSARGQIRRLPSPERAPIFARALNDLRITCAAAPDDAALVRHCREQAEFVMLFPECDDRCQTLAATCLPRPRR